MFIVFHVFWLISFLAGCNPDESWTLVKYLRDATYDLIPFHWVRKRHGEDCQRAWFPVKGTVKAPEYTRLKETCAKAPSSNIAEWLKVTVLVSQGTFFYIIVTKLFSNLECLFANFFHVTFNYNLLLSNN